MYARSIVVDDVDGGDVDCCPSCYSPADDAECNCHHHHHHQFVLNCLNQSQSSSSVDAAAADSNDAAATAAVLFGVGDACDDNSCDARSDAGSTRSSRGSTSREENENRLQQIKVINFGISHLSAAPLPAVCASRPARSPIFKNRKSRTRRVVYLSERRLHRWFASSSHVVSKLRNNNLFSTLLYLCYF